MGLPVKGLFPSILLLISPALSGAVAWSLQVTDPRYELSHYDLGDGEFKPYLERTSWRCFVGSSRLKGNLVVRDLRCNYSLEKTGEFTTTISCRRDGPPGEALIDLYDERKNLSFKVKFRCRPN